MDCATIEPILPWDTLEDAGWLPARSPFPECRLGPRPDRGVPRLPAAMVGWEAVTMGPSRGGQTVGAAIAAGGVKLDENGAAECSKAT